MLQREAELILRQKGEEKGVRHIVLSLCEEMEDVHKTIKDMAEAFESLATVVTMQNKAMDGIDNAIKRMTTRSQDGDTRATNVIAQDMGRYGDD